MNKRFFNQQNLTRRLRLLPVLFAMLLMPLSAWAQTTYKGGDYSSTNNSWGDWTVTGTNVEFSSSGSSLSCRISAGQTSTIQLSLTKTQNTSEKLCALTFSPSSSKVSLVSAKIVDSNDETITEFTTQIQSNGSFRHFTATTPIEWGAGDKLVLTCQYVNETNTVATPSISGATVTTGTPYDLVVDGIIVTTANKDCVTGGTTDWNGNSEVSIVSFDPTGNKLNLCKADDLTGPIQLGSSMNSLTIDINGNCKITTTDAAAISSESAANITFTTSSTGSLNLKRTDGTGLVGSNITLNYNAGLSAVIVAPTTASTLADATEATIKNSYNITVAGVMVTEANAGNITGDNISGTVSYDVENKILTLNNANITGNILRTNSDDLTVNLVGSNEITIANANDYVFVGNATEASPKLTLTTDKSAPGTLKVNGLASKTSIASGWSSSSSSTFVYASDGYPEDGDWWVQTHDTYMDIVLNRKYDLLMNGRPYCDANLDPIAGAKFIPETSTLEYGYTGDYSFTSSLPALTVKIKTASAAMASIAFAPTEAVPSGTLTFKAEDSSCKLTLLESFAGFGDNDVIYEDNLVFRTITGDAAETFSVETISKPTMTGDGSNVTFTFNAGMELHYSIDYVKEGVADVTDATISTSGTSVALSGPCTVTAYTKWNNSQSDEVVGKLFGFATESVSGYAGQESIPFSLVPAINVATDGLTLETQTGNENIVAAVNDAYDTIILGEGLGLTFFRVTMKAGAETPYTILNYIYEGTANIGPLDVKVSVAEPTVSPDATGGPFNIGQLVTLGYEYEPSNDVHSIKYIVGEDLTVAPTTYTAPFALNETAAVNAWVETTYSGNKYSSDTVTVNYAIKQDPKLKVSYTWYRLRFGETFSQEVTSDMPTTPTVTWSSSNTDVATVDPTTGVVTPVAAYGSDIEITATFAGDDTWSAASVSYAIRVDKAEQYLRIKYKGTNIPLATVKVEKGNPIDIKTEYDFSCPEELVGTLVWYSNDESVVTVTNGVITTVGCGSTWIKVSSAGNSNYESDYCDFNIEVAPPKPTINLAEGTYLSTHAPITITKENIANTAISYTWDDITGDNNATWKNYTDDGVTFQGGTLSARVEYYDAENYNTIYSDTVSVAYTVIIDPELKYMQGTTEVTTAEWTLGKDDNTALPVLQNTHSVAVTYESSNTDVATVATDGTVTAVGIGTATITATSAATSEYAAGEASYTLTVNRQLNVSFSASNTWATYCGTENLSTPEGLKAYQVTAVEGATVTISEIGYIPANTAVLLQNVSNNNTWSNIPASAYTGATSTFENNKLIGTASAVDVSTITGGTVYILVNNMFRRSTSGSIPANRGYLVVEPSAVNAGNAPQLSISIGDENTTAISNTDFTDNTDKAGEWYSIDGVKLNGQPQKLGLYIKNGKKVFINKK